MNYHLIKKDDMLNGEGLRVTLFVSGCDNNCYLCHNPQTHNPDYGIQFGIKERQDIIEELKKDYVSGLTLSGGDPLHPENLVDVIALVDTIRENFGETKTIWLYTGSVWEDIHHVECKVNNKLNYLRPLIVSRCDVLVDGKFIAKYVDVNYPWAGSRNQRVIDVKKSLIENKVVLWKE